VYGWPVPRPPCQYVCCRVPCRIVWAKYDNGKCSDQHGEYKLGEGAANTPMRCGFSSRHASCYHSLCPLGFRLQAIELAVQGLLHNMVLMGLGPAAVRRRARGSTMGLAVACQATSRVLLGYSMWHQAGCIPHDIIRFSTAPRHGI